jgi:outer membrane receptor protein involved in Fe transport
VPGYNWNADVDSHSLTLFGKKTIHDVVLAIDVNQRVRKNENSYRYDAHTVYSGYNYDSQWHDSYGNSSSRAESQSISPRIKINNFLIANNALQMGYEWLRTEKSGSGFLTFGCSSGICNIANNTGSSQYQTKHQTHGLYFRDIWDVSDTDRITAGYRRESYSQNYAIDYGGYGSSYDVARTVNASELEYSKKFHVGLTGYLRLSENFRIANVDDNSNTAQDSRTTPFLCKHRRPEMSTWG